MTTVQFSIEVDAPPQDVWEVASDPANLPQWDRHIIRVRLPDGGVTPGVHYEVDMGFMAIQTTVRIEVEEWEPPWRSIIKMEGLVEARITTSIAKLPYERSMLRHEVDYRFRGPLGRFGAASLNALGGAQMALRHGVLAQKRQIEDGR
jgi:carbon monoxide dehydrogenase subunit G